MPELSYKTRRRLSLVVLFIWLPVYILIAMVILSSLPRMHIVLELIIYVVAGLLWALPFKFIFKGVGKADPDKPAPKFLDDDAIAYEKANRNQMPK